MVDVQSDDTSLNEIFGWVKKWFFYVKRKWLWVALFTLIGGAAGFIYARRSKPKYSATLTFVLSTEKAGGGGFSGIASQFGLDLGGGSGSDVFSGDNIIGLMKSRNMITKALLRPLPSRDSNLANLITKHYELDKFWLSKPRTQKAYPFPSGDAVMTPIQDSLLRELHSIVSTLLVNVSKPEKKQSFYQVISTSFNEQISFYLTKYLVETTSSFYISTKTSISRQNLTMLQHEADSLRTLLGGTISSVANVMDMTFNMNPAFQSHRSSAQEGQVRATALGTAYSEVLKNLELAKISVQKETPLYQIIDAPTLPLEVINLSRRMYAAGGLVLATFIMLVYFTILFIVSATRSEAVKNKAREA
jgi:hypothetical protein